VVTFEQNPWEYEPRIPEELLGNKTAFNEWKTKPGTEHCFFCGFEGMQSGVRINKTDNPPQFCHALVADYDIRDWTKEKVLAVLEECPSAFMPNWVSMTYSNGARLVWLLESRLSLDSYRTTQAFVKHAFKALSLPKILPALDEPTFLNSVKYYEAGKEWVHLHDRPIPNDISWTWLLEASSRLKFSTKEEREIPLPKIKLQLEAKYPNVEFGDFLVGQRFNRFWDSFATNTTSAILREGGFQCFSGDEPFKSWRDLLGSKFVDSHAVDRTVPVMQQWLFDGSRYFCQGESKIWNWYNTESFKLAMKVDHEFNARVPKDGQFSELDRITRSVQEHRRIEAAVPFIHHPAGLLDYNGKRYLNIATATCLPPSGQSGAWGEHFGWLAQFLDGLFTAEDRRLRFLAWWKHFYCNGLVQAPQLGQALFLVGPSNCGKTLLNCNILSKSVGGHMDASQYIVNGGDYSGSFLEKPVMTIDDGEASYSQSSRAKYASRLKKIIANPDLAYDQKYEKAGQVRWLGRVVITMNDDPDSLQMLPDLQQHLVDKLIIFKVKKPPFPFPSNKEVEAIINRELPHLLQWLVDWEVPRELIGESRFGVESFCEHDIKTEALGSSPEECFLELVRGFFFEYQAVNPEATIWTGTPTDLVKALLECEALPNDLVRVYTARTAGFIMKKLEGRGYPITGPHHTKRGSMYDMNLVFEQGDS
jgi:hypothetical protein